MLFFHFPEFTYAYKKSSCNMIYVKADLSVAYSKPDRHFEAGKHTNRQTEIVVV